jgi:hypothetical protein
MAIVFGTGTLRFESSLHISSLSGIIDFGLGRYVSTFAFLNETKFSEMTRASLLG